LYGALLGSGAWANGLDYQAASGITVAHILTGEPGFVDPTLGDDYHLAEGSAAIDQGLPTPLTTDLDGQPRPNPDTGLPDLGADEFWPRPAAPTGLSLNGLVTATAGTPITLTAVVSGTHLHFTWSPYPSQGQGTAAAVYDWLPVGTYTISVRAENAGGWTEAAQRVTVVERQVRVYLPLVGE
jgi:hypothetical protein